MSQGSFTYKGREIEFEFDNYNNHFELEYRTICRFEYEGEKIEIDYETPDFDTPQSAIIKELERMKQ